MDLRELEARLKAVLRRASPPPIEASVTLGSTSAQLIGEDGHEIPLTSMEFNLLKLFALNQGRVLNRDQILEGAHDRSWEPFDRSIDIRISRIRRKIEVNAKKPLVIRTVRGIGYIYDGS